MFLEVTREKLVGGDLFGLPSCIGLEPCIVARESFCLLFKVAMFLDHHAGDLVLKSPNMTVNWDFEQNTLLSKSSNLKRKDSNSGVL